MSNIFFISDTHFSHHNIIKYCYRPFSSIKEMDETIIENWNNTVKAGDLVYHLGDFAFVKTADDLEKITKRLNGNIYLILGNHDRQIIKSSNKFVWKRDYARIKVGSQKIILSHYAFRVWDCKHHGSYHLYGHSHGTLPDDEGSYSIDVGVDAQNFTPISFEQVVEIMGKKKVNLRKERK